MRDKIFIKQIEQYLDKIGFSASSIKPITNSGVSSNVFMVKTSNGHCIYLKISHTHDVDFHVQKIVTDMLINLGVKTPKIIFVDMNSELEGRDIALLEDMVGSSETSKKVQVHVGSISEQIAIINSTEIKGFGEITFNQQKLVGKYSNFRDYFLNTYELNLNRIVRMDSNAVIKNLPIHSRFKSLINASERLIDGRLVHADIPSHIFIDNNQYVGIIDFDDIHSSLPYYDIFEISYAYDRSVTAPLINHWYKHMKVAEYEEFKVLAKILYLIIEAHNAMQTFGSFHRQSDKEYYDKMCLELFEISRK